jgi:FYVE/RhoGEF/PH domain-containing protein 5/6
LIDFSKERYLVASVQVHANDEGSAMSGYLWVAKNKKWKRLWFVVKGKVLYTYKASEVCILHT